MSIAPHQSRRGFAHIVHALLAAPVVLGMLGGIADMGWTYHHQRVLDNVAEQAVRVGALQGVDWQPGPAGVAEALAAEQLAQSGLFEAVHVSAHVDDNTLTLTVESPHHPLAGVLPSPARLSAQAVMPLQGAR